MSDGGEEDLSSVAWPGFVDILSAVIIIFVFFVMIISLVLYHHMITYKARVITQIEEQFKKEKESQTSTEEKDSDEAVADMIATIEVLEKQLKAMEEDKTVMEQVISDYKQEFYQARAEFDESEDQILKLLPEENAVIVFFDKQSISLTAEVKETLAQIINEKISEFGSDQL